MNCPDYRPFHGSGYRQAPSSCRSTAKSPQRRSPAPAAAMASAASGSGEAVAPTSVAVSETDVRGVGRSAASDAAAAAIPARGAAVGRGSSCDPGERSGGRARQESMAARRDTRPRHAPAPEGYGTLPPPKAAAHHLRRPRRQRPLRLRCTTSEGCGASAHPHGGRHSPNSQPPPQPMEPVAGTSSGYSPFFHDVNGSFANLRQLTTRRRPSPPTFSPEITDMPVQTGNYRQQGYSNPASDAKCGAFSRCCRANRHFAPRRQSSAVRS